MVREQDFACLRFYHVHLESSLITAQNYRQCYPPILGRVLSSIWFPKGISRHLILQSSNLASNNGTLFSSGSLTATFSLVPRLLGSLRTRLARIHQIWFPDLHAQRFVVREQDYLHAFGSKVKDPLCCRSCWRRGKTKRNGARTRGIPSGAKVSGRNEKYINSRHGGKNLNEYIQCVQLLSKSYTNLYTVC